jgi:cytochrome c oxidase subunit II
MTEGVTGGAIGRKMGRMMQGFASLSASGWLNRLSRSAGMALIGTLLWLGSQGSALADVLGQPTDKSIALQPAAAITKVEAIKFHDHVLMPIITAIVVLVFALLVWIVVRYNKRANPVPAKFSHNSVVEVIWTAGPVLILVYIAFHSFALLRLFNDMPKPDVVVKATGNQWYWTYDFPELGVTDVESRLLPEAADLKLAHKAKVPYLLAVDNPLIVPVGKVVHVQVTASDVIHAFAMPAFGIKIDAMPGRLNNTWFKADKVGVYYGQCSELCGVDHAYMPIEIHVVTPAEFDAYIIKSGGKTKEMLAAEARATADAAAASAIAAASASSAAPAVSAASSSAAPATPASTPAPATPAAAAAH